MLCIGHPRSRVLGKAIKARYVKKGIEPEAAHAGSAASRRARIYATGGLDARRDEERGRPERRAARRPRPTAGAERDVPSQRRLLVLTPLTRGGKWQDRHHMKSMPVDPARTSANLI